MNYQFYGTQHGYRTHSPQPPYPADPTAPQYSPQSAVYSDHDPTRLVTTSYSLPYPTDGEPSSPMLSPVYRAAPTYWGHTYASTTPPPPSPPTPPQQFHYYDHAVSPQYQYQYSQCN